MVSHSGICSDAMIFIFLYRSKVLIGIGSTTVSRPTSACD